MRPPCPKEAYKNKNPAIPGAEARGDDGERDRERGANPASELKAR